MTVTPFASPSDPSYRPEHAPRPQQQRSTVMFDDANSSSHASRREPWNKGKLIGAKPPLQPKHVWSIRTRLEIAGQTRDLAMFNLAVDSKLRGCDLVALKVEDLAPNGYAIDRATVRQKEDRSASQVRADRSNASSRRSIFEIRKQEA